MNSKARKPLQIIWLPWRKGYIARRTSKARNIEIPKELSPLGIPLISRVPADTPLLDVENIESSLDWSSVFGDRDEKFAVHMRDNSMRDAGIEEGDYVVVSGAADVEDGSLAAVAVDDTPLVRRIFLQDDTVRLVPEGDGGEEQTLDSEEDDVRVLGAVKGIVRRI
ncbi:MAG: S24 family peptidase [Planctomycetota bacterium]